MAISKEDKITAILFAVILILCVCVGWGGYEIYSVKIDSEATKSQNASLLWRIEINEINATKKLNAQIKIDSLIIVKFEKMDKLEKDNQKEIIKKHESGYEKIKSTPDSLQLHLNDSLLSECAKYEFTIRVE